MLGARIGGDAIYLAAGGTLDAAGTGAQPVTFGGGTEVLLDGQGKLSIDHANFTGDQTDTVLETGCAAGRLGGESVTIKNSVLRGQVELGQCDNGGGDTFTLSGNAFEVPRGVTALSIQVAGLDWPSSAGALTVDSNRFEPRGDVSTYGVPNPPAPEIAIEGWPVEGFALSGVASNQLVGGDRAAS